VLLPQAAWVQQVALTFGFCITVLAYKIGHQSGGQINCAVTIGLVLAGELPVAQALANFVAQVLGSVSGAALLALVKSEATDATGALGSNSLAPGIEWHQALVGEIICTFLLMGTVLETAINHKSEASRPLAALAIGMSVYVAHSFLIPVDGCSINPTRSIGPAIVATLRVDDASAICEQCSHQAAPVALYLYAPANGLFCV
jgi:MIP family channel proteins